MPNITRCPNGHFYDPDKYRDGCPYCNKGGADKTVPLNPVEPAKVPELKKNIPDDGDKTIGFFDTFEIKPVVGWLVSVEGTTKGKDFRLCAGRNYIGRSSSMDINLEGDVTVSRDKHAIIIFDPISQCTLCQPGDSRELFYLNNKVVTGAEELHKGDLLKIGKTLLMFVPFCGDLHKWENKE